MSLTTVLTVLCVLWGLLASPASAQPPLTLSARLDQTTVQAGDELRPEVRLVNTSDEPVELHFVKPWMVVPEIWDGTGKTRLPNAPSVVWDQIVVPQSVRLAPRESLELYSIPVVIEPAREGPAPTIQSHWYSARPGDYRLRYRVRLSECLPGAVGTITSNDLPVTVLEPPLTGILSFEAGRGYFLTVDPRGNEYGVERVWLRVSENKILVGRLDGLKGRRVTVKGSLQRLGQDLWLEGFSLVEPR